MASKIQIPPRSPRAYRLELTLFIVDSRLFYICFQAQEKFCSTPHLISHLVFLLSVSSAQQIRPN